MTDVQACGQQDDVFPWRVMSIILTAVLAHSISITSLFPFVAFMVVDLGLVNSVNQAGAYAGYICGALMMGRFSSSLLWGIVADKWGRKPVMVISTISICGTSLLFGFAKSFEVAVLSRFLMGFGNAIVGTSKTLVPELVQKPFRSRAMALVSGTWNIGMVLGPMLGGLLARPALQYPTLFCGIEQCKTGIYLVDVMFGWLW